MATVMGGERERRGAGLGGFATACTVFFDSDIFYSFRRSPVTVLAFVTTVIFFVGAFAAPILAPFNTNDVATLNLMDAFQPPAWIAGGSSEHFLGTDDQGRDVLSAIMFGTQVSLIVGFMSVIFSVVLGVGLGLISGYVGGRTDHLIMRIADVQLSFPAVLVALLLFGFAKAVLPRGLQDDVAIYVLIVAIGLSNWVQFARTVPAARPWWRRARNTCRRHGSSAAVRWLSWFSTCYPTSWGRCWSSPPSAWRWPSSPKQPCHFSVWACRRHNRRWAR